MDKSQGKGAAEIVQKITVNIGTIRGGLMMNMIPGTCNMDVDIRLPVGSEKEHIMTEVKKIAKRYPEVSFEEICYEPPIWSDPDGELVRIIQANIKTLTGVSLEPVISLGATDARLWSFRNVPAYLYAPVRGNFAAPNEHVEIEELIKLVKIHVLSAYDYLTQ
jgi:succinyl-diaminopimelate desuccinylase